MSIRRVGLKGLCTRNIANVVSVLLLLNSMSLRRERCFGLQRCNEAKLRNAILKFVC